MLLSISVFILCACSTETKTSEVPDKFPVTTPLLKDTSYAIDYVANIKSVNYVELRARVKGYIEKIGTDEGKEVKKGQILFSISNQEYKEALLKAKANLKMLQAELKTQELEVKGMKNLSEKNVVSKTELEKSEAKLDAVRAQIESAEAEIAEAEINLERTEIKAPFDGIIDLIPNKTGSLIDEGTLLSTVTNNSAVYAYFNVSEREYLDFFSKVDIATSEKVALILANNSEHKAKGIIETVNGKIEQTGNLTLRAQFENPDHVVKHGSSGKVRVYVPIKNALIIPQKSTFEIQDKNFVYVVNNEGVIEKKSFVPKFRLPNLYVVESGIGPNDKIIYEGVQYVKEGDKITAELTPIRSILNKLK